MDEIIKEHISRLKSDLMMNWDAEKVSSLNALYELNMNLEKEEKSVDAQIEDEFQAAEHFLNWYHNTKDKRLLDAAHDEVTHGLMLIDIYERQGYPVGNMRSWATDLQRRIKMA